MARNLPVRGLMLVAALSATACGQSMGDTATEMNGPAMQRMAPDNAGAETAETVVLAGGCFWGVEAVYEHTKGVLGAVSGYAGGEADTAHYEIVGTGRTGHAESVRVSYDPKQVSLEQLLDIYFRVAHDPTQLNYQGPDHGTQYRSTVFYATPEQRAAAEGKIAALEKAHAYRAPIVTTLEPLRTFYPAEAGHQDFAARNPDWPYIVVHDAPKVANLKKTYPELYRP